MNQRCRKIATRKSVATATMGSRIHAQVRATAAGSGSSPSPPPRSHAFRVRIRDEEDRTHTEVTEGGRVLAAPRLSIQPRDDRPDAQQDSHEQEAHLRSLQPQQVRRKLSKQLIDPEEVPLRLDSRKAGARGSAFCPSSHSTPGNAGAVGQQQRQRQQRRSGRSTTSAGRAARSSERTSCRAAAGSRPIGQRHALALNEDQVATDHPDGERSEGCRCGARRNGRAC